MRYTIDRRILDRIGQECNDLSKLEARFWTKVNSVDNPDDCWEWTACTNDQGYGRFRVDGKVEQAHRVSYGLVKEFGSGYQTPSQHVLHTCHNESCVNPEHLIEGDPQLNVQHAIERGTHISVTKENRALTSEDVVYARARYDRGATQAEIADELGCSPKTISRVVRFVEPYHFEVWGLSASDAIQARAEA